MTEDEYITATDAATIRAAIKVLSDLSGGNENVSQVIRLLRDEEFKHFEKLREAVNVNNPDR